MQKLQSISQQKSETSFKGQLSTDSWGPEKCQLIMTSRLTGKTSFFFENLPSFLYSCKISVNREKLCRCWWGGGSTRQVLSVVFADEYTGK